MDKRQELKDYIIDSIEDISDDGDESWFQFFIDKEIHRVRGLSNAVNVINYHVDIMGDYEVNKELKKYIKLTK